MKEIEKASDIDIRRAESAALLWTARGYIPISKLLIREKKTSKQSGPRPLTHNMHCERALAQSHPGP